MVDPTKYPIGIQTFEKIIRGGYAYADKTEYIYRLAQSDTCYFLSRPRRFGKSLLLSTIEAYFMGKKELFEGLSVYNLERDWTIYPVIRFDFSSAQAYEPALLSQYIHDRLKYYTEYFNVEINLTNENVGNAFGALIAKIAQNVGQRVVILIDEYDKGIIETIDDQARLDANQNLLRSFYSQIKANDEYIRFAMLTGVSRFRHLTIFSGFNNPDDISMSTDYAAICGFTKNELRKTFKDGVTRLSETMGIPLDDTIEQMQYRYDGYRFSKAEEKVFNPFSIINALKNQEVVNYWLKSGTSKVFIDYLSRADFDVTSFDGIWASRARLESTYSTNDPVPLLYQTGYLTIKDVDDNMYRLGIPNGEVRDALVHDLVPYYMGVSQETLDIKLWELRKKVKSGDIDGFLTLLKSMIASVPYQNIDIPNLEKTYHLLIYQIFLMIGIDTHSEISMSGGRIDMVVQTTRYVYVIEFKLGGTPRQALKQIDDHGYAIPWMSDKHKEVYKIGVVFSSKTRTLSKWEFFKVAKP